MKQMSPFTSKIKNLFTGIKSTDSADLESCAGQYWQLSGWDERIQDQAHWCDVMRWPRERWIEYGDFYFAYVVRLLKQFAGAAFVNDLGRKTTLEWGCGGGANIRCLGKAFSHVYGVDISEETLNECGRQMEKCGLSNFSKVKFPAQSPEMVLKKIPAESVDFILSIAVFQHFPSKAYTRRVLHVMEKLLKKDGLALIQVRYFDGSEKYRQKDSDYAKNVITMTSFTFGEFSEQLQQARLTLLHSEKDIEPDELCHEYYLVKK